MKYGPVYIFGAAAGNSSPYASWDLMKIYGGLDRGWYNKSKFRCCLAYKDDGKVNLVKVFPARARGFMVSSAIWSLHVTCFNVKHDEKMVPLGAALTIDGYNCSRDHVRYVSPYFPQRETSEKVAIGTKTAYGNISAELIIEWMEAWRYIGVDKVIAFYIKSINEKALRVLQYYVSTGILDLYFYEPAASGTCFCRAFVSIIGSIHTKGAPVSREADWPMVTRLLPAAWLTNEIGEGSHNSLPVLVCHSLSSSRRVASQFKTAQPGHASSPAATGAVRPRETIEPQVLI